MLIVAPAFEKKAFDLKLTSSGAREKRKGLFSLHLGLQSRTQLGLRRQI